jgi:hypothetical protein
MAPNVHEECRIKIEEIVRPLINTIESIFSAKPESGEYAFQIAVDKVQAAAGTPLINLLQTPEGKKKLFELFNTIGLETAQKHAAIMRIAPRL